MVIVIEVIIPTKIIATTIAILIVVMPGLSWLLEISCASQGSFLLLMAVLNALFYAPVSEESGCFSVAIMAGSDS